MKPKYNPDIHHRKSIRLKDYDYSQNGAYFITICVYGRECLFGKIVDGKMELNDVGEMIKKWWHELKNKFSNIELDEYIVMPNHLHGIIYIVDNDFVGAPLVGAHNKRAGTRPAPTIGNIIGAFKSITMNEYINGVKINNWPSFDKKIWQRNYYEHVIRNEIELNSIREYIVNNPLKWPEDENNPDNIRNNIENNQKNTEHSKEYI